MRRADPGPMSRLGRPPATDALRGWLVTIGVTLLAAVLRLWNLGRADRPRHPRLRREALRAAGLADGAQRRGRGQPRLREGRAPAAGQAADRARRDDVRLRRRGLADLGRAGRGADRAAGGARGPAAHPVHGARRAGRGAADLRRAVPRAVADGHARRVLRPVRRRRVHRAALRPRRRARPDGVGDRPGPGRRRPVRPAVGCALVAAGHRGAARAGLRREVVGGSYWRGRVRACSPCSGT